MYAAATQRPAHFPQHSWSLEQIRSWIAVSLFVFCMLILHYSNADKCRLTPRPSAQNQNKRYLYCLLTVAYVIGGRESAHLDTNSSIGAARLRTDSPPANERMHAAAAQRPTHFPQPLMTFQQTTGRLDIALSGAQSKVSAILSCSNSRSLSSVLAISNSAHYRDRCMVWLRGGLLPM